MTSASPEPYDCLIIGGGPASLTAAVYWLAIGAALCFSTPGRGGLR
jgi:thioredoxin reductase